MHLILDAQVDSVEQMVHALLEWRVPGGPILILLVNIHARPVHIVVWNHRPLQVRHPAGDWKPARLSSAGLPGGAQFAAAGSLSQRAPRPHDPAEVSELLPHGGL